MQYVLVFISGGSESSIDQGMMIVEKGYDEEKVLEQAEESGIDAAEIAGSIDISDQVARDMGDWRLYIG